MNVKIRNNNKYYYESYWREKKNDEVHDSEGKLFPYPIHRDNKWLEQGQFIKKLTGLQNYLKMKNKYKEFEEHNTKNCILCDELDILNGTFMIDNIIWRDDIVHYIEKHNIKPSDKFIDRIFKYIPINKKRIIKYKSEIYSQEEIKYLKLDKNQILIMDALLKHGGYDKKYMDDKNKIYRYSEHVGLLDFNNNGIEKIIISGETSRIEKSDSDIYMPKNIPYSMDYEYIFHTHPPTPKPGGRAEYGILYEFPSTSDIVHFIEHYNNGNTQGSLVICSEGLYNIRKQILDNKKIKIDQNIMYKTIDKTMKAVQKDALKIYGYDFTSYVFYSQIAQDTKYIDDINKVLNKFKLHIDYYPRVKNNNKWIIDTIHLPVFITNPVLT